MQKPPRSCATTKVNSHPARLLQKWVMGSVIGVAALWAGSEAFADAHEGVTVSHGYTNFGELKYGPDAVLDYVNPDAPKGGDFFTMGAGHV